MAPLQGNSQSGDTLSEDGWCLPATPLIDTLLRFGLGQPLVQAWVARAKAKPRTDGEGEAADHPLGMGSDSEGSDWE